MGPIIFWLQNFRQMRYLVIFISMVGTYGTFDVNGAAHVALRILAAILLASKNGGFNRVLLGSSLQKLDYQ